MDTNIMANFPQYDVGPETRTILVSQRFSPDAEWSFVEEISDIQDFDPGSWDNATIANALDHLEAVGCFYECWPDHSHELFYQLVVFPATPYWIG